MAMCLPWMLGTYSFKPMGGQRRDTSQPCVALGTGPDVSHKDIDATGQRISMCSPPSV
jgi:hypothetical protein